MANLGATVLVGSFEGVTSPARHDTTSLVSNWSYGADGPTLRRDYEYAIIVLEGALLVARRTTRTRTPRYLSSGDDETLR